MSLSSRAFHSVEAPIRGRGWIYFSEDRVHLQNGTPGRVLATVKGPEPHEVVLAPAGDFELRAWCDCPRPHPGQVCEHVWAAILATDATHCFEDLKRRRSALRVVMQPGGPEGAEAANDVEAGASSAPSSAVRAGKQARREPAGAPALEWRSVVNILQPGAQRTTAAAASGEIGEIGYVLDLAAMQPGARDLTVETVARTRSKRTGQPNTWRALALGPGRIDELDDAADAAIFTALYGAQDSATSLASWAGPAGRSRFRLARAAQRVLLPMIARTGRALARRSAAREDLAPIGWDEGAPYALVLKVAEARGDWEITGALRREGEERPLAEASTVLEGGLLLIGDRLARYDGEGAWTWIALLHRHGRVRVPAQQRGGFLDEIYALPNLPELVLPEGHAIPEEAFPPTPRLSARPPAEAGARAVTVEATLLFEYDHVKVPAGAATRVIFDRERRRLLRRDPAAEAAALDRALALGFHASTQGAPGELTIAAGRFPAAVRALVAEGFQVEAEGRLFRKPGAFRFGLRSGIDWFDLDAKVDFEGVPVDLGSLLDALRRGDPMVRLGDGTMGVLPEEWLRRYGVLAQLGEAHGDQLRFKRSQVGLLDALLAAQPEVSFDDVFARAREELRNATAPTPADPPPNFHGELRGYQRAGLGWLRFLERIGFGGCLADDMGLGKTVQVLALLAARKFEDTARRPSLVIAPRSLIFNWKSEAARFAPDLRILDHTGPERLPPGPHFADFDLVLTTYGVLRRDAAALAEVAFDYAILDEAQAIKNAASESAKAARLLRADHRLALSGTPVENHLGELWSLFEFLNPGLLGRASVFKAATGPGHDLDDEAVGLLGRALRPFLLRRTKGEVAKDLPERVEHTLTVELEHAQRRFYEKLREHYRASLLDKVKEHGLARSKMHVLEALLRLRQAACHPGLVDDAHLGDKSAKLDALFVELPSLIESGKKALIFSQFTSLLAIVRKHLDKDGVTYEYLDGRTRDRQARVERFQNDAECPLFLVSLKAGGLGLNLTAAEYVFLLDPWWNPAAEAQAIDRAHRIGQTQRVFAYRLIAKDTIEERIAELQQRKRKLAESVIAGDGGVLKELTAEDLELLLS